MCPLTHRAAEQLEDSVCLNRFLLSAKEWYLCLHFNEDASMIDEEIRIGCQVENHPLISC